MRARVTAALAALLLFLPGACRSSGTAPVPPAPPATTTRAGGPGAGQPAVVVRVVDGDTVEVRARRVRAGDPVRTRARVTVRLLAVDTPETVAPDTPVECFGPEAAAATGRLLAPGTRVRVTRDVTLRDRYGRHLLYVWRDGALVNAQLVRRGYAYAESYAPNVRHRVRVRAAQRRARRDAVGLWRACPGAPRGR